MAAADVLATLKQRAQQDSDREDAEQKQAHELVGQLDDLEQQWKKELEDAGKAEYDKGFKEGLAQTTTPGTKVFSNEELDKEVAEKVEPLQKKVDELQAQIDGGKEEVQRGLDKQKDLQAQIDKQAAELGDKVKQAVADLKRQIGEQIHKVEVDNTALANQLIAEANAPTPVVSQDGEVIAPPEKLPSGPVDGEVSGEAAAGVAPSQQGDLPVDEHGNVAPLPKADDSGPDGAVKPADKPDDLQPLPEQPEGVPSGAVVSPEDQAKEPAPVVEAVEPAEAQDGEPKGVEL